MEQDSEEVVSKDTYVAMWCVDGFEGLYNWSADQRQATMNALCGKPVHQSSTVSMMKLRAHFNPQRHYEIYAFNSTIPERELYQMFVDTPQVIVDWIRANGEQLYSDRVPRRQPVIV